LHERGKDVHKKRIVIKADTARVSSRKLEKSRFLWVWAFREPAFLVNASGRNRVGFIG
jgi:hypothetical protein